MVINLDQTPRKITPGPKNTHAKAGSNSISIGEANNKRMVTVTFAITLSEEFVPIQLTYRGKTSKSLPRVKFP